LAAAAADAVVVLHPYVAGLLTVTMEPQDAIPTGKEVKAERKLRVVPVVLLGQEPLLEVLLEP